MTSQIRVDEITNRSGLGTVTIYDNGFEFTGVTTFTEDVDITGGLTIGGVLTYEDVTNIDSVGVVTARGGLDVSDTGTPVNIDSTNSGLNKIHFKTGGTTSGYLGNSSTYFLSLSDSSGNQRVRHANSGLYQVLDTSGNVIHQMSGAGSIGIGTAPVGDLTVLTTSNGYVDINGSGGNGAEIRFLKKSDRSQTYTIQNNGGVNELVQHVLAHSSGRYSWSIGGTERLRITSGGSVGFNTTFTQSSKTVHIAGDYRTITQNVADEGLIFQSFGTASTGDVYPGISWSGNPTALGRARASINAIATNDNNGSDIVFLTRNAADGTELDVTDDEKLRITSAGDMGLGTATPTSFGPTFQVAGTDPALLLQDTATAVDYFGVNVTSGISQLWYDDAAAFTINTATGISGSGLVERLRIDSSGNLLLKTGEIDMQGGNKTVKTSAGFLQLGTSGSHHTAIITAGTERARISSAGDATFKYKVTIGDSYAGGEILSLGKSSGTSYMAFHNGGANMGFIGYADQLISGGGSNELGIRSQDDISFATGGNAETLRLTTAGYAYFGSYPTTHTVMGGSPIKVRSGAGAWGISIGMRYSQNDYGYIGFSDMNGTENLGDIHVNRTGTNTGRMAFSTNNGSGSLQRLRIESSGEVVISDDGTFRDQRMPLVITGRGFGHGTTSQGTTQDAIYLTAGASGNYSTLTLTVDKSSWGSVAYEIHAAAYNGRHLHRVGGFYQNGNNKNIWGSWNHYCF